MTQIALEAILHSTSDTLTSSGTRVTNACESRMGAETPSRARFGSGSIGQAHLPVPHRLPDSACSTHRAYACVSQLHLPLRIHAFGLKSHPSTFLESTYCVAAYKMSISHSTLAM